MPKQRVPPTKPALWWNHTCQEATQARHHAAINDDAPSINALTNAHCRIIKEEKQDWVTHAITHSKYADIWDIAKWSTGQRRVVVPPIISEDSTTYMDNTNKANHIAATYFPWEPPISIQIVQDNNLRQWE
ncbi:hypothetical protein H0H81_002051, partial [Sphagnurus paluster]